MNAKVRADNELYNRAMGEHSCGIMNENGERLVPPTTMSLEEHYFFNETFTS